MEKENDSSKAVWWFIPGGVLLGMRVGFLINKIEAGLFLGMGLGFFLLAITLIFKKNNKIKSKIKIYF